MDLFRYLSCTKVVPDFLSSDLRASSRSFSRHPDQTFAPYPPHCRDDRGSKPAGRRDFRGQGHWATERGEAGRVLAG